MNNVDIIMSIKRIRRIHETMKNHDGHTADKQQHITEAFILRFVSIFMFSLNLNLLLSKCLCAGTMRIILQDEMPWHLNASILQHKHMVHGSE